MLPCFFLIWGVNGTFQKTMMEAHYAIEYVNCQECESDNDDYDVGNFISNESKVKPNSDVKSDALSVSSDKDSFKINESIDEECDISSSKDDIPLFDFQKRLRGQVKSDITSDDNIDSEYII